MPLIHFVLLPLPAWGHIRPLCVLAARLVSERDEIVVTILTAPNTLDRANSEISRQFHDGHSNSALKRIRIVSTFQSDDSQIFKLIKPFAESYPHAYKCLYQAEPITCSTTGKTYEPVPSPVALIMDFFATSQLQATRAISGNSIPVFAWITGGASTTIRLFGPESIGGLGNFGARIDAEATRTGKPAEEIGDSIFKHTNGAVINIPGLPAMYDYEFFPQKLPFETPVSPIVRGGYMFLMDCEGIVITTTEVYEKASLEALKSWFAESKKPVYAVGPLLPPTYGEPEILVGEENAEVQAFLEASLSRHGVRSLIFMSFGTVFWPTKPEYIDEVLEAFIEKRCPFILSYASPFAKISEELVEKVRISGLGMLTKWSPQQFILNHPATGWFLTHGGHGGITESLGSGIPLICWPFDGDQPAAAAHLSENLGVAFELVEVRTGNGLQSLCRTGQAPQGTREAVGVEIRTVIDASRGQQGAEMRKQAEKIKVKFAEAWEGGGTTKSAIRAFLNPFFK